MILMGGASSTLVSYHGEEGQLQHTLLGVGAVIPPWNFPNAILTGMTGAAIVAGNCVVLKPASLTPTTGYKFCELLWNNGLPPGVLNYVPGAGAALCESMV